MNRRRFLRGAGLVVGGAAVGSTAGHLAAVDHLLGLERRSDFAQHTYATEHWGDPALDHADVLWRVDTTEKVVALTFDDGPVPANTVAVLDILAEKRAPATFNLIGQRAVEHADLVSREMAAQHEIGNHTWSHRDLAFLTREQVEHEMRQADEAIDRLTGRRPRLFRPPKGQLPGDVMMMAARLDYTVLMWSLQLHETSFDAAGNVRYVLDHLQPGMILLAHDTGNASRKVGLEALPSLIDSVRAEGYAFATVSDLLATARH